MTKISSGEPGAKWVACVVVAWTAVVLGADLKVSVASYFHWIVSAAALLLVAPCLLPLGTTRPFPARLPAALFVGAICLPALYGANLGYSMAEAGKLFVILLCAMPLFVTRTQLALSAFLGFMVAVCLNALLLLGGLAGFGSAEIMALDRWGTILNYPGSLWRVAITAWLFAAYLVIVRRSLPGLALLAASTLGVFMDGARTALFLLALGVLFLIFVLSAEAGRAKRSLILGVSGLCCVVVALAVADLWSGQAGLQPEGAAERMGQVANSYHEAGFDGLEVADAIRFQMLADVSDAIRSHPLLGSGILTTTSETIVGPMVIHMTYLQVWADLGLLGLIAYGWLVWGWILWLPATFARITRMADPMERAIYYNAIFLLIVYGLTGFFHPLSTEWSEWIVFVVPYALFWKIARRSGDEEFANDQLLRQAAPND